jgi:threonyl-tRNA synthetase
MKFINTKGKIINQVNDSNWKKFNTKPKLNHNKNLEKILIQDPVSGKGHFLFLPKGAIMFNLLKQYMYNIYSDLDCFFLESPILTDYKHIAVRNHAEISGEKTYHIINQNQHLITKIGALYSQLELASTSILPNNIMPLKFFEMTRCCRIEDYSDPLKRSSEFTMVDMHELCNTLEETLDESLNIHSKILELGQEFNLNFYTTFTMTNDFLSKHKSWLTKLTKLQNKESLILPADPKKQRPINVEYHIMEETPLEISAFQIDYQNPEKFKIYNEAKTHPILIHANIVGSIERFMYAIIKTSNTYPLWLAPEQVRIIPQSENDYQKSEKIGRLIRKNNIRVTLDDRTNYASNKKYSLAKADKIPYIYSVEKEKTKLTNNIQPDQLIDKIKHETINKPFLKATYPLKLSKWPEYF